MGSGGIGAVSFGIAESVVFLILAVLLLFGVWKVVKLILAALAD